MSQEFEIKRLSLEEQRDRLQQQLDNLKEELSAKLNMANQEVGNREKEHAGYFCGAYRATTNRLIGQCRCPPGVPPAGAGEGG